MTEFGIFSKTSKLFNYLLTFPNNYFQVSWSCWADLRQLEILLRRSSIVSLGFKPLGLGEFRFQTFRFQTFRFQTFRFQTPFVSKVNTEFMFQTPFVSKEFWDFKTHFNTGGKLHWAMNSEFRFETPFVSKETSLN